MSHRSTGIYRIFESAAVYERFQRLLDRGRRVRTPQGYRALAAARFPELETALLTDLMPIPHSHLLMRASKA